MKKRIVAILSMVSMLTLVISPDTAAKMKAADNKKDTAEYIVKVDDTQQYNDYSKEWNKENKRVVNHKEQDEKYLNKVQSAAVELSKDEVKDYQEDDSLTVEKNYQLQASATLGVARGLHKTLAVAGERLFYVSRAGVVSYSGGVPEVISQKLGDEVFTEGAAGSDGRKYYASLYGKDGWNVYVYDTDSGLWMKEDELAAEGFAWADRTLYCLAEGGALWKMNQEPESGQEQAVTSFAEFGDFTEGSLDRKKYIKMQIRLEVETGEAMVSVQYDGEEQWHVLKVFEAVQEKTSVLLSFRPRRCDRFRIRIDGTGAYTVYGITRKVYGGSEI